MAGVLIAQNGIEIFKKNQWLPHEMIFFFCTTKIFCLVFILEGYKIWSGLDLNFHPKKFQKLRKITIFEILNKKQYFIVSSEISYMRKIDNKGTYSQEGKQSQPIGCNHSFVANRYL